VPLFSNVAVWSFRAVFRLPVKAKPDTVSRAEPWMLPTDAWIVVCPGPTAVANAELLIVAAALADEVHVAVAVRFCVLLSE
jgi:hypothetical protein